MLEFTCPHCGAFCSVPRSLAGGRTNCSHCGNLVEIPGVDYLFIGLVCAGAIGVLLLSGILSLTAGVLVGGITLLIGMAILGALILAS